MAPNQINWTSCTQPELFNHCRERLLLSDAEQMPKKAKMLAMLSAYEAGLYNEESRDKILNILERLWNAANKSDLIAAVSSQSPVDAPSPPRNGLEGAFGRFGQSNSKKLAQAARVPENRASEGDGVASGSSGTLISGTGSASALESASAAVGNHLQPADSRGRSEHRRGSNSPSGEGRTSAAAPAPGRNPLGPTHPNGTEGQSSLQHGRGIGSSTAGSSADQTREMNRIPRQLNYEEVRRILTQPKPEYHESPQSARPGIIAPPMSHAADESERSFYDDVAFYKKHLDFATQGLAHVLTDPKAKVADHSKLLEDIRQSMTRIRGEVEVGKANRQRAADEYKIAVDKCTRSRQKEEEKRDAMEEATLALHDSITQWEELCVRFVDLMTKRK
ncbi:hypothetical protein BKA64DRAFT_714411 [Cadophora sp. MPI-SDFR-AT-0126]|nr:hypothetical protein BKA64DRAFT_714411 [Leotiomycetes sp. MPI-SDFR-AT-0126]